jgi:hypothetical protein
MQIFYCLSNFGFDAQILRLVNISWTNVLQKKHALMDKCTAKIKHSIKASKPKLLEAEVTLLRSRSYLEAGCFTRVGLLRKLVTYKVKRLIKLAHVILKTLSFLFNL